MIEQTIESIAALLMTATETSAAIAPDKAADAAGKTSGYIAGATTYDGPWYVTLIPFIPIVSLLVVTALAITGNRTKLPAWITVAGLATAFGTTLYMYTQLAGGQTVAHGFRWIDFAWGDEPGQRFTANFAFYIDSLTCLWMLFVTGLATMIALYASEYMSHDVGTSYCRFFAAFNLFVFSMSCLVMGDNLVLMFLGWEGVGLCSYMLIGYFFKKPAAVAAAKKAFIVNRIGDLALLMGIFLTFTQFGTVQYAELFERAAPYIAALKEGRVDEIPALVQLIPALLMIGSFGKSAQFPLYVWLPDAMEGPTPVSALIHAATMVTAGVYLIARTLPLFLLSEYALPIVAWVGTITAFLAATIGMAQFDIKRIMAYSTVSQLGYMFVGLATLTSAGGAFHVFTHAFFKATLFLSCGAVMHGFAGQLDLRKLSGLWSMKGWWVVSFAMLVGCLNLAGVPMTAGYFSKDMILAEAFTTLGPGYQAIGWILLLTAGMTAYYTFRVFFRVFVGPPHAEPGDDDHGDDHADHADHSGHSDHGHGDVHGDGHGDHGFHPHAPGWAINTVLTVLAVGSIAAAGLYFAGESKGWVGGLIKESSAYNVTAAAFVAHAPGEEHAHGTILGFDPHKAMYYVSAVFGVIGIGLAAWFHGPKGIWSLGLGNRTEAGKCRADAVAAKLGPVPRWAENKWYVDEFYDRIIVSPLRVLSEVFKVFDKLVVDGLVNLAGLLPRLIASALRPLQSGGLQNYAVQMVAGLAILLLVAALVAQTASGGGPS
ncbi:MAG: NADH-quinone oxidoreductase subunit L [Planctomycetota bacterium]